MTRKNKYGTHQEDVQAWTKGEGNKGSVNATRPDNERKATAPSGGWSG